MRLSTYSGVLALFISNAAAFPTLSDEVLKRQSAPPQGAGAQPAVPPPFDAARQRVSTTGNNRFISPSAGDQRGQCPGLNALANHGYLPRSGVATIQQFVTATYQGFGMAQDLSTFLAVYGAIVDGDGTRWSIGGVPRTGILGSHGNYETDSSPIRSDLNQYGANNRFIMSQFMNLYNRQPDAATANYNLEVLRDFRDSRFKESIQKNPFFVYGPFTGIAVSQAAFTFIYRFMSNKSAEAPEGILNKNVMKTFMSVSGPEDALVWNPGQERFPENWYKRNDADQYSIPYFQTDIRYFSSKYPDIISVGCNQGRVNSYKTISPESISSGVYTAQSVAESPLCFSSAVLAAGASRLLGLDPARASGALATLTSLGGVGCPTITDPDFSQFRNCPGFSFYGGPMGPVAPGAIMS